MANERRVRANLIGGMVEDNPSLLAAATSMNSAGLGLVPVIGTTEHFPIVIDPDGRSGPPEIAYVTAHTAANPVVTLLRGQEGTTARDHPRDTYWAHAITVKDMDGLGGGAGLIGVKAYQAGSDTSYTTTSTSLVDVDATNLVVSFVAPPSGKVLVRMAAGSSVSGSYDLRWGLRDASAAIANSATVVLYGNGAALRPHYSNLQSGLTPGATYNWRWAWSVSAGSGALWSGPTQGQALMEVWAVNL